MTALPLTTFSIQVAGHNSLLQTADGRLVKPCPPSERLFYERLLLLSKSDPSFHTLLHYVPSYYGPYTLDASTENTWSKRGIKEAIVLSNLLLPYTAPCIMDIKLGTQLYDPLAATQEKQSRMLNLAATTTSGSAGMRVSGLRIFDSTTNSYTSYDKSFGKSLTESTLHTAFTLFTSLLLSSHRLHVLRHFLSSLITFNQLLSSHIRGQFIGTSFLFIFEGAVNQSTTSNTDNENFQCNVHWIDFAHSSLEISFKTHDTQFLVGVNSVINAIQKAINDFENL